MKRVDWALLAVIIGCTAFLLVIGLQASAHASPLTSARTSAPDRIHLAARLGAQNHAIPALRILDGLNIATMNSPEQNAWHLTKARLLVQIRDLDGAVKEYNAVSKDSPLWIDAIEEKGEVTAREGKFAQALAILQTALAPQFQDRVHPLTFFVASLTHLKVCDYPGVFTVSQQFKRSMKSRMPKWHIQAASGDLTAMRMIAESKTTLHDLQIIEADVIQRMSLASRAADGHSLGKIPDNNNVLRFPVSHSPNPEVWRDELGHYAAQVKTCPAPHLFAQNKPKTHVLSAALATGANK